MVRWIPFVMCHYASAPLRLGAILLVKRIKPLLKRNWGTQLDNYRLRVELCVQKGRHTVFGHKYVIARQC